MLKPTSTKRQTAVDPTGSVSKYWDKRRREQADYEANPKRCLMCNEPILFEKRTNKFCNQSCAASFNNRGVARHYTHSNVCSCGSIKKRHNKYCVDCSDSHVYQKPASFAEAKSQVTRKRIVLEKRGYRCEGCGLSEWLGKPIPIEVHHIDGNSDNDTEENWQLLCPNCHAFTDNYKGANKGKEGERQKRRRSRYAKGLSW